MRRALPPQSPVEWLRFGPAGRGAWLACGRRALPPTRRFQRPRGGHDSDVSAAWLLAWGVCVESTARCGLARPLLSFSHADPSRLGAAQAPSEAAAREAAPAPRSLARRALSLWPLAALWAASRHEPPSEDAPLVLSEDEWRALLSPAESNVLREWGTEFAGSSPLDKLYDDGTYVCKACNTPLWRSGDKFNSGTGWPSFSDAIPGAIDKTIQPLYLIGDFGCREVRCHHCASHQGHMFTDGPKPTGLRYCINGVAINFVPEGEALPEVRTSTAEKAAQGE